MTKKSRRRLDGFKLLVLATLMIYIALLAKLTLFRSPLEEMMESWTYNTVLCKVYTANFTPFRTIKMYLRMLPKPIAIINLVGNVVGFIPLGFLPPFLFQHKTRIPRTIVFGFFVTLFIEITQLLTGIGEFDVDDILLNSLGVILGRALFALGRNYKRKKSKRSPL